MASSSLSPTWIVNDDDKNSSSSSGSLHVNIPPGAAIQCPSSASIVSFDKEECQLRKKLIHVKNNDGARGGGGGGGLSSSFFLFFLGNHAKTIKVTVIENTSPSGRTGTVLLSPKQPLPCTIVMHLLDSSTSNNTDAEDALWISTNAYLGSDSAIQVEPPNKDDLMMRLSVPGGREGGGGYIAIAGMGGVQKYTLKASETKTVAIGHLLACSDRSTLGRSDDDGQQFCHVQGPGVLYVQTHAQHEQLSSSLSRTSIIHRHPNERRAKSSACRALFKFVMILSFCLAFEVFLQAFTLAKEKRAAEAHKQEYGGSLALGSTPSDLGEQQDPWQEEEL
jgi:hypothetical protein